MKQINQPNIQCGSVPRIMLMPGDPGRSTYIAKEYLNNSKLLSSYREFIVYAGTYKGMKIGVCSTGIGSPSTAIATEELITLGATVLIRVGTCGGALKKTITAGSLIIPTASIRDEGTTTEYVPNQFPAIADRYVVNALERSAKMNKFRYFVGINRTHDGYYGRSSNLKQWGAPYLDPRMKTWTYPLLSSEMECSPIFLIGLLRGIQTGAVLAVNSYPEDLADIVRGKQPFSTPNSKIFTKEAKESINRAIQTALDASLLIKNN